MNGTGRDTHEVTLPLSAADEAALHDYLSAHPAAHVRQSLAWLAAAGPAHYRVFVTRRGGAIVAASLVEVRHSRLPFATTARIARGPLFDDGASLAQHLDAVAAACRDRAASLHISPFVTRDSVTFPAGWEPVTDGALYDATLVVPVLPSEDEQWRTLRRSTRTSINRARERGLAVAVSDDVHGFATAYNAFAAQRGLAAVDAELLAALAATATPAPVYVLAAMLDGVAAGGALFTRNGNSLAYEWGWTDPAAAQGVPVLHSLLWAAIGLCRDAGVGELDLGGYWPDRGNDDPINHVKLGFSKDVRYLVQEHCRVLAPARHAAARILRYAQRVLGRRARETT